MKNFDHWSGSNSLHIYETFQTAQKQQSQPAKEKIILTRA